MAKKERLTENFQTRITESEMEQLIQILEQEKLTKRDVIIYFITHHLNPRMKLMNKREELVNSISNHKESIINEEKELAKINSELRIPNTSDPEKAIVDLISEKLRDNYKIKYKEEPTIEGLASYITSDQAIGVLNNAFFNYNIKDTENFKKKIYDNLGLKM